jgi:hypothetical protein
MDSADGKKTPAGCLNRRGKALPVGWAQEFALVVVLTEHTAQLWQLVQVLPAGLQAMV